MKVCVLAHASRSQDERACSETAALAAAGHEVTVLTLPSAAFGLVGAAAFVARRRAAWPEVVRSQAPSTLVAGALIARLTGARLVHAAPAAGAAGAAGAGRRARACERLLRGRCLGWTADPTEAVERTRVLALYERLEHGERERVRDAYGAYAVDARKRRAWGAGNAGNAIMRAEVLARILDETSAQRAAGERVLDIGCGGGWWLGQLAQAGVAAERLHGVDLIAGRVARAREAVPGARVEVADATALPFGDAWFGVVLLLTTLSSAGSPARGRSLLAEARRVLAPGGVLVVYEPRLPNPRNPRTRRIARRELVPRAGDEVRHEPITLIPFLGRRLGERGRSLSRVRALRSHRLTIVRAAR